MRNFAPQAQADPDHAVGWLLDGGGGGGTAENLLKAVLDAAEMLARRPRLGRSRLDLLPEPFRFWSIPRHNLLLVYRADTTPPLILRVLNTARDLAPLLTSLMNPDELDTP